MKLTIINPNAIREFPWEKYEGKKVGLRTYLRETTETTKEEEAKHLAWFMGSRIYKK
jgi:hypothetical protein